MTKIIYKSEGEIKACYEGKVRDKKPHGRGDLTFANGDNLFSKEFDAGDKPGEGVINNGKGKFVYAKKTGETGQDSYNGKIDGNVSHGNGTYIIANSGDFEGRFSNGYPTKGTYITQRGDEYAVRWDRDGKQWWLMVDGKEVPVSSTREQSTPKQHDTSQQLETDPTVTPPPAPRETKATPSTPPYTRTGNTIYFGMYPQSEVKDRRLKATLTRLAGTLPTSSNGRSWTSYGYYISGEISNFMWYIDVENAGEKYRGVYFTSYRPFLATISSSSGNSQQCDNGYQTSTVYWFKYEPVKWRILEESGGKAFLLADIAIDSHEYHPSSNNYANSTIRKWLNETFYNTAFNELQKELIQTTMVDNSVSSTGYISNSYVCANTSDKVFLLSYKEATTYLTSNSARIRKSTDYAKSQGIYSSSGNCWWWLRSPYYYISNNARHIYYDGSVVYYYYVYSTRHGVVPALWIAL